MIDLYNWREENWWRLKQFVRPSSQYWYFLLWSGYTSQFNSVAHGDNDNDNDNDNGSDIINDNDNYNDNDNDNNNYSEPYGKLPFYPSGREEN